VNAVLDLIEDVARDVGRLRRFEAVPGWLVDRLAGRIEALDAIFYPSAAEVYRRHLLIAGDDELAVTEALAVADARAQHLRLLTTGKEAQ
jgi:hypothetical protein